MRVTSRSEHRRGSDDGHEDKPATYTKLEVSLKNVSLSGCRRCSDDGHEDEPTTIIKIEVSFSEP
jgi:hypothetical protein